MSNSKYSEINIADPNIVYYSKFTYLLPFQNIKNVVEFSLNNFNVSSNKNKELNIIDLNKTYTCSFNYGVYIYSININYDTYNTNYEVLISILRNCAFFCDKYVILFDKLMRLTNEIKNKIKFVISKSQSQISTSPSPPSSPISEYL